MNAKNLIILSFILIPTIINAQFCQADYILSSVYTATVTLDYSKLNPFNDGAQVIVYSDAAYTNPIDSAYKNIEVVTANDSTGCLLPIYTEWISEIGEICQKEVYVIDENEVYNTTRCYYDNDYGDKSIIELTIGPDAQNVLYKSSLLDNSINVSSCDLVTIAYENYEIIQDFVYPDSYFSKLNPLDTSYFEILTFHDASNFYSNCAERVRFEIDSNKILPTISIGSKRQIEIAFNKLFQVPIIVEHWNLHAAQIIIGLPKNIIEIKNGSNLKLLRYPVDSTTQYYSLILDSLSRDTTFNLDCIKIGSGSGAIEVVSMNYYTTEDTVLVQTNDLLINDIKTNCQDTAMVVQKIGTTIDTTYHIGDHTAIELPKSLSKNSLQGHFPEFMIPQESLMEIHFKICPGHFIETIDTTVLNKTDSLYYAEF